MRFPDLTVPYRVYLRPLGPPETAWCDEHNLPCRLVQHFALEGRLGTGELEALSVVVCEDHA